MTYSNEERQDALDWLKAKIKPRLPYAKGGYRMTEEQLNSITIDLDDQLNKARINYLLQMVWKNWVHGGDYMHEWEYRLLPALDDGIIAMDGDCDCNDYHEGDPNYFDIYCKLYNNSEAIGNATAFIENMEHLDVQVLIGTLKDNIAFLKWKYEPENMTEYEKRKASMYRFERRDEEEVRKQLAGDNFIVEFPGDSVEVEADDEALPLPI